MEDSIQSRDNLTPMLRQYFEAKAAYPDAVLFFRLGDFYEMFFDDALEVSRLLELTLTHRNKTAEGEPIPMCGVPYHAAEGYVKRLVEAGRKVAVCDQVEDPRLAKGIVRREVRLVVTPGVRLDVDSLDAARNNYLLAVNPVEGGRLALAFVDVSTGLMRCALAVDLETAEREWVRVEPSEVLLPEGAADTRARVEARLPGVAVTLAPLAAFADQPVDGIEALGEPFQPGQWGVVSALAWFLDRMNPGARAVLTRAEGYAPGNALALDANARRNLELFETLFERRRKGSLLGSMDRTQTAMGARLLRDWLAAPLMSLQAISARQDAVQEMLERRSDRERLRALIDRTPDLERLTARAISGLATPRDLGAIRGVLGRVPGLEAITSAMEAAQLSGCARLSPDLAELSGLLERALADSQPLTVGDGGVIRPGFHPPLDEWRGLKSDAKDWLLRYEAGERERTGIPSLKVGYNRVFGYYIEISRAKLGARALPDDYIRKQTIATGERYYTPTLKEHETRIVEADDRALALEAELFADLRAQVAALGQQLMALARGLASLDVLTALAEVAAERALVRPVVDASLVLEIVEGRHPMVEETLPHGRFIPNDLMIQGDKRFLHVITGPNMAGKSTIMRQAALIVILAQVGSFVPAREARVGLVDGIFTRVGASDNLVGGQSTFMVEMVETAAILKRATRQSLILLDEIGRGTGTFDGLSIAWAVAEHLHDHTRARTLFATHYHELTDLEKTRPGVRNLSIAVKEWEEEILFLRKLVEGGTSRSYGIQVARLAGLPASVTARAREVLKNLEQGELDEYSQPRLSSGGRRKKENPLQISLFGGEAVRREEDLKWLKEALQAADPNRLTPLEALTLIHDLKKRLG